MIDFKKTLKSLALIQVGFSFLSLDSYGAEVLSPFSVGLPQGRFVHNLDFSYENTFISEGDLEIGRQIYVLKHKINNSRRNNKCNILTKVPMGSEQKAYLALHRTRAAAESIPKIIEEKDFILKCHQDSNNIESLRRAFRSLYSSNSKHLNIEKTRKVFFDLIMQTAEQPLDKVIPLPQLDHYNSSEMLLREFDERTSLHSIPRSTLFMNLNVHDIIAEACVANRPEAYPICLDLLDYFIEDHEDDESSEFLSEINSVKLLLKSKCREYSQEKEEFRPAKKQKHNDSVLVDPFDLYNEATEQEANEEQLDFKEAYLNAYIAGYDYALLDLARLQEGEEETFAYYYFAATIHQLPEGYWGIGEMLRDSFKLPDKIFSSASHKDQQSMSHPDFWFGRMVKNKKPTERGPITREFPVSQVFILAEFYERQAQSDEKSFHESKEDGILAENMFGKSINLYRQLQEKGYVRAFLEEGRIIENTQGYEDARIFYKKNEGLFKWWSISAQIELPTTSSALRNELLQNQNTVFNEYFLSFSRKVKESIQREEETKR